MNKMSPFGVEDNFELMPITGYQLQPETQLMIDPYMFSIMNYQNYLNLELLKNQNLIATYMNNNREKDRSISSAKPALSTSEGADYSNSSFIGQQNVIQVVSQPKQNKEKEIHSEVEGKSSVEKKAKKSKKISSDEDYEPQKSDTQNYKISKSSESKNVPKNFSKAILLFIKRKQNIARKLVEQENFDFNQFMEMTSELKGKINSIAELRSLWIDEENKFAKVYRILSNMYLRHFSLQHIFNSRVEDYSKHLKYRNKMRQVIKNPRDFTRMKDY